MSKVAINTDQAPKAIGTYSQAIKVNDTVYMSGQIPLLPDSGEMVKGDIESQIHQVFKNLAAVAKASGGELGDAVKLNVYLVDLANFAVVNKVMGEYLDAPYPARAAVQVSALPKNAQVEVDAVLVL